MDTGKKNWIVIASGERPLNEISEDLSRQGFKVNNVFDAIGQITAESSADFSGESLNIKGIAEIVPMGPDIQLPGPEEDLTW